MNGQNDQLSLRAVLLIIVGTVAGYLAYQRPAIGPALVVGVGVVGLLHLLLAP
ncbi:hypothetical protein ACFWSF_37565 [Streptomyces sp. NPDC058611]|uniref:hypothetical protein n=1 Tax=unclassified Streptomyces TaxID=2593676 RepID=UPI00365CF1CE